MTEDDVTRWLTAYESAWRNYDPDAIADLFSDDAEYRYCPWGEPVRGRAAIADSWCEPARRDEPGTWTAEYAPWVVQGDRAVITGTTSYNDEQGERTYHNAFLCEFDDDGRCRRFTEWYMRGSNDK